VGFDHDPTTVPITSHSFDPIVWDPGVIGPSAAVGVLMRWQGHTDDRGTQPFDWPFPFGAICWYRIYPTSNQLEINRNLDATPIPKQSLDLAFGVPYVFKARVETIPGLGGLYRFKGVGAGPARARGLEPPDPEDLADPQSGSILLLTHHVDASFGTVTSRRCPEARSRGGCKAACHPRLPSKVACGHAALSIANGSLFHRARAPVV